MKRKITGLDTKKVNCVKSNQADCKLSEILLQYFPLLPHKLYNPCNFKKILILIIDMKRDKRNMLYSALYRISS